MRISRLTSGWRSPQWRTPHNLFVGGSCRLGRYPQIWGHLNLAVRTWYECRDIKVLAEQLDVDVLTFQHIYLDSMNRQQTEYLTQV